MSHNMLEHPSGLYITRFAGPARDDGGPRTMYQITVPNGQYAQLDPAQWTALVQICATIAKHDGLDHLATGDIGLWSNARAGIYDTVSQLIDSHEHMIGALLVNCPQSWDGDDAAEHIAVQYLHHLESEVQRLGGSLERNFGEPNAAMCLICNRAICPDTRDHTDYDCDTCHGHNQPATDAPTEQPG